MSTFIAFNYHPADTDLEKHFDLVLKIDPDIDVFFFNTNVSSVISDMKK